MRKYLFIFLLYGVANGQIPNPCEDERFIKISEKSGITGWAEGKCE